ncbi:hypothetical protein nbrc107697_32700 [Gordonia crocea]|uniref:Uncharacterized protein n=1 Tax=Gordonia crocea TaxID=589162 RepID=A0A7I9V249_9ACTN|nr:hypothetical protein nbrc107697_32700 [Gordonia crocea]
MGMTDSDEKRGRPIRLSEDWWATIAGMTLLALVLVGAIPGGLVP